MEWMACVRTAVASAVVAAAAAAVATTVTAGRAVRPRRLPVDPLVSIWGVERGGQFSPLSWSSCRLAVSWPWVPAWGSLEPPRQNGENAQKTGEKRGKNGRDILTSVKEEGTGGITCRPEHIIIPNIARFAKSIRTNDSCPKFRLKWPDFD